MVIPTHSAVKGAYSHWSHTDSCCLFIPPGLGEEEHTAQLHKAPKYCTFHTSLHSQIQLFPVTSRHRYWLNAGRGTERVNFVVRQSECSSDYMSSCRSRFSWGQGKFSVLFHNNKRRPCDCMQMRTNYYTGPLPSTTVSIYFWLAMLVCFL